jgi:hypothetical protein
MIRNIHNLTVAVEEAQGGLMSWMSSDSRTGLIAMPIHISSAHV